MKNVVYLCSALALTLTGCGGGSDGGNGAFQCAFVGGSAIAGMSVGGSNNVQDSVDGNLTTFARINGAADGQLIAGGVDQVEGGGNVGLFVTMPTGTTAAEITVNTRNGQTTVQTATGPALTITDVAGTPGATYVGFDTTLAYKGVEFLFSTGGEYFVYEFCHSANVN